MTALRLDRAFVQALRDGSLAEHEREWLANQLDAAVDKPADAAAALGLERSRQEQSAQAVARHEILREAGASLPVALSMSAKADLIRSVFLHYRAGAWRRDRVLGECPVRHRGTLREFAWRALRLHESVPEARTIRRILGQEPMRRPTA